ncbi:MULTISPECIES: hypothetical protein [Clostridium]|uniref:Uncharacterized protein n=1 Tax=Clostridium frigoriphilum TaxID=443253 RepID=A0ABU7UHN0_9CLOT|nr:hypothetical protein [Clostridium sp. DSM 17811]MBU3098387.1 hypothetical protein [Clostridium sp. DSM 17811]
MLLNRYKSIDYVMDLDINEGIEQITQAYRMDAEDKLYKQYLIDYGNMDKEHYMSFESYKEKAFKPKVVVTEKNVKEILKEAERIKAMDQKGGK